MKTFNDSHLEVKKYFKGSFETHPYEVGWADEAIFFVMVEKIKEDPLFEGRVQLSQDGVHWADDGSAPVSFKGEGLHIIKVESNFGNFLRLAVKIEGGEMFLNLHIACKG
jgi:hypothetical protein